MMIALPSVVRFQLSASVSAISSLRIELVVGLLRLAGGAVEEVVDDDAVEARIAAGADVGVADAGHGRQARSVRASENHAPSFLMRVSVGMIDACLSK